MGWQKSAYASAFLVDHHRGFGPFGGGAQSRNERADLIGCPDIAAEQNEAPRPDRSEERRLLHGDGQSGAAEDAGQGQRTKQLPPAAFSRSHKAVAWSRLVKPVIDVR